MPSASGVNDILSAREVAARIEAQTGYKTVSWQEANEDLLSAFQIRNFIMYAVVGAILLVASFGIYNIISTITHEKTRDIAILKSLGFTESLVRRVFLLEAMVIGLAGTVLGWGLGFLLCQLLGSIEFKSPFVDATHLPIYLHAGPLSAGGRSGAVCSRHCRLSAGAQGRQRASGRDHSRGCMMSGGNYETALIEMRKVTRMIGDGVVTTLVRDIELSINSGEFVAITGPSGSGKSSLLYLLGLLDVPTSGEVLMKGAQANQLDEEERAHLRLSQLGFVFQFHFLLPEFTALANVTLPMRALARLSDKEMRERALGLLASLGLEEHAHKLPGRLSGGERQRVAIARALSNEPFVILADEPTGNLDTHSGERVLSIFRTLVDDTGRAVVMVTHDLDLAARTDRQIRLVDGEISSYGGRQVERSAS